MKSSSSMIVKVVGMFLGLLVSLFLGRVLGAEGLGVINLANQLINLLLTIALLGFSKVIIKEVAIAYESDKRIRIKDVLYTALIINGLVGFICTLILIFLSEYLARDFFAIPQLQYPLIILSLMFVPQVVSRVLSAALLGYKKVWQSNLVDQTMSIGVTGVILFVAWLLSIDLDVVNVAIAYALGRLFVTTFISMYWLHINKWKLRINRPRFLGREIMSQGFPLLIVSASLLVSSSADTLMLGWLSSPEEVGLYSIAARLALLTSFVLQVTVSAIGPKIAVMYHKGEIKELEQMLQKITLGLTFIGLAPLIIFILSGRYILSMWGDEFVGAYSSLIILSFGQFVNIASGPVGNLLIMTSYQKLIRNITTFTVVLNLILNYTLIGKYGSFGAALATSITTILNMVICFFYVKEKLNIRMFNFYLFFKRY